MRVGRKGRKSREFLVERCFAITASGLCRVLLREPRVLIDTTAWSHMTALRQHHELGRAQGHRGLLHEHFTFDRAISGPMRRHVLQLVGAFEDHLRATQPDLMRNMLHLPITR